MGVANPRIGGSPRKKAKGREGAAKEGSEAMSLLNQAAVTKEAMETAKRYKKDVTQVSQDWKNELEQDVRMMIFRKVMAHTKGKTLKP